MDKCPRQYAPIALAVPLAVKWRNIDLSARVEGSYPLQMKLLELREFWKNEEALYIFNWHPNKYHL